jgi:alpha-L-rhamnosidase
LKTPIAILLIGIFFGIFLAEAIPGANASEISAINPQSRPVEPSASSTVFLPLVILPSGFGRNPAIWARANHPAPSEVTLFRHTFKLGAPLAGSELAIFADTRYEVWLDGAWIGRGPARFSHLTHEYDLYPLGDLAPGEHLIAALVQWAPNYRRSESTTPYLQASIQGKQNEKSIVVERTGPAWKVLSPDAWRQDASLVHSWGLIGPTELLDLSRLPADWMKPAFSDGNWPSAVEKDPLTQDIPTSSPFLQSFVTPQETQVSSTKGHLSNILESSPAQGTGISVTYQPRSIAPLESVSRPILVHDAGLISPGRVTVELVPPVSNPYLLAFNAVNATPFTVEVVSLSGPPSASMIELDGKALAWVAAAGPRPGVYVATRNINRGAHHLAFSNIPSDGLTLDFSTANVQFSQIPFQQGVNAGRRTLLAELSSQPDQVVLSGIGEINAAFSNLPAYLVLDLGRVVQGRLTAQVAGPAGTIIDIGWDERLYQNNRPLPFPGPLHKEWNQVDSWILDGNSRSIGTLDTRAGRYILVAVWGDGPVLLDHIQVFEEHYPLKQVNSFTSSDPILNRAWQVGADSALINMSDGFTDTPWRERGQWWGDAYTIYHTNLAAFGDNSLLKRGLALMAEAFQDGRPNAMAPNGANGHMLDFGMLWAQNLKDYWQATGDLPFVRQNFPVLTWFIDYLRTYKNPTTGLLDIPSGPWATTTLIDWLGSSSRTGQSTAVNALYHQTLLDAATLAQAAGEASASSSWNAEAQSIKKSANQYLYVAGQHLYLSSIVAGKPVDPSPHAQAWALAEGLVPDGEVPEVAASLLEMLSADPASPNVDIYGMYWVLEALAKAGQFNDGTSLIDSYYGRLLDLGATTWWETFKANQNYSSSLSHGWGSGPTWFLTHYILGAQQTGPRTWLVKPAFSGVQNAAGGLPLPTGFLQVSWADPPCGNPGLEITAPSGTRGQAVIPFSNPAMTILVNGAPIWQNGNALISGILSTSDGIHINLQSGHVLIEVLGLKASCPTSSQVKR